MTNLLSYSHGPSTISLLGETIGQNLRRTVGRFGHREALVVRHQHVRMTYSQLWNETTRCAYGLLAHGVQQGDRVGIWAPNRYEWVVFQYAAARVAAILVNVNPAYRTAELEYALRQSGVSVLVHARHFRQTDYVAMLARAHAELRRSGQHPVHVGDDRGSEGPHPVTPQRPQQRLSNRRADSPDGTGSPVRSGAALS